MITDPHVAWGQRYRAAVAEYNATEDEDAFEASMAMQELICRTPAATLAGLREQLLLLHAVLRPSLDSGLDTDVALLNGLATVEQRAVDTTG
jgi:hypothetical protein